MKLVVEKDNGPRLDKENDTYYIPTAMLSMGAVHMFIGYKKWETIYVELSDDIPHGSLRFFPSVCSDIKVKCTKEINDNIVRQLAELFPDLGGKVRRWYFAKKDIMEVIPECRLY